MNLNESKVKVAYVSLDLKEFCINEMYTKILTIVAYISIKHQEQV
jgi:hypothetical protein